MRAKGWPARFLAGLLCLVMVFSVFDGVSVRAWADEEGSGTAAAGGTLGVNGRVADPDTTDSYVDLMLSEKNGSRYAGRVWTDKSVFAAGTPINLNTETDGYEGTVGFTSDFAHVFSALDSSQVVNEYPPTPIDLVIVFDMSGSMGQDTRYDIDQGINNYVGHEGYLVSMADRIENSRVKQTLNAINTTIDTLMAQNQQNRVAVCAYGANATVLLPLAHYRHTGDADTPYLTVGGMETLYHPSDLVYLNAGEGANGVTVTEAGWYWTNNRDTCYTVVVNEGNQMNTFTGSVRPGAEGADQWVSVTKKTVSNNVLDSVGNPVKAFPGVATPGESGNGDNESMSKTIYNDCSAKGADNTTY